VKPLPAVATPARRRGSNRAQQDGADVIDVSDEVEPVWTSTRVTQRDEELAAPRPLQPLLRIGIGRDVEHRLRTLRRVLERGPR
jgi:hypothetical protein